MEAVPGVRAAHPLVSVPVIFKLGQRRTPIQVIAYDSAGAPRLAAGRPIAGPRQIVLDERLARLHGLNVGWHPNTECVTATVTPAKAKTR